MFARTGVKKPGTQRKVNEAGMIDFLCHRQGGHVRNDGCPKNLVPQENQSRGFSGVTAGVTAEIRMTLCSPQSWFPLISVQTCLNEERHVQNVDFLFGVNSGVSTGRPDGGYRLYIRLYIRIRGSISGRFPLSGSRAEALDIGRICRPVRQQIT